MNFYHGIDVSSWQGEIDFSQVAASGVQIVYIKVTEGNDYIDPFFSAYYEDAHAANLMVGFYHVLTSQNEQEALDQAQFFARAVGGLRTECRLACEAAFLGPVSNDLKSDMLDSFLSELERLTGLGTVLYTTATSARYDLSDELAKKYPLWVAEYGVVAPSPNGKWEDWAGWQYTDAGNVPGIAANVDLDYFTPAILTGSFLLPASDQPADASVSSRAAYYIVRPGDTLSGIGRRFGISAALLARINQLSDPSRIYPGQVLKLFLPLPATGGGAVRSYVVRPGDSLYRIARRFGVTVEGIVAANELSDPDLLYPGQVLRIPGGLSNTRANPSRALEGVYTVQPGDTLLSIARRFQTSPARLALLNGLSNPGYLFPGQVLKLSASPVPDNAPGFRGSYIAQEGDTLLSIARHFNTDASKVARDNEVLDQRDLIPGQTLVIR